MSSTQQITGISSGMDTASIVESLMKIERIPYEKLDIKKQTQNLKLQAYQAVNSMLMKFRTSVSTLSSQKLWKSKAAITTNEKVLTATANEYAVNGSYSFRVAQLATATQYMSKGFASSKTPLVKQAEGEEAKKIGEINLNSSKTRVDTSAKLDVLNGGRGIYRGSIRVTDGHNRSSVVDLSSCDTLDDVVRTLNNADNATIHASIKDGKLHIQDTSGGTSAMKIQNVGTGTTATDLGIAGSGTGSITGRAIYVLGDDTSLKTLNDGLGVEEGLFNLRVTNQNGYYDVMVNVDDCHNVGDIIKRVNDEMQARIEAGHVDRYGGLSAQEALEGLRFGVSESKTSFALTGTTKNFSYQFYDNQNDLVANQAPASGLGLANGINRAANDNDEIVFDRVLGDANSPMLKNLSGVNGEGVGGAGASSYTQLPFNRSTLISQMNSGRGLDISRPMSILVKEAGDDGSKSSYLQKQFDNIFDIDELAELTDPTKKHTVADLVTYMNKAISEYAANPDNDAAALAGMYFQVDEKNARFVIAGGSGGYEIQMGGTMATQLGLFRHSNYGTEMDISDKYYTDYDDRKKDRDEFYGLDTGANNKPLVDNNGTIYTKNNNTVKEKNSEGKETTVTKPLTTMQELSGMFKDYIGAEYPTAGDWDALSDADKKSKLQGYMDSMLSKGMTFQFQNSKRDSTTGDLNPIGTVKTVNVTFDVSQFSVDDDVESFMEKINNQVQRAFDVAAGYCDAAGTVLDPDAARANAPELRLHSWSDRMQWSNMDWTKGWSMTDTAAGGLLGAAGLERGAYTANDADNSGLISLKEQHTDAITHTIVVKGVGYWQSVTDQTKLKDLNNGAGLQLNGNPGETLDIELAENKSISIDRQDIYNAFTAKARANAIALGEDPDATGFEPQNFINVEEYLDILNNLAQSALNGPGGLNDGVADADKIDFQFALSGDEGTIVMTGLKNVEKIKTSGPVANPIVSGIGTIDVNPGATVHTVEVGQFIPKWETQELKGLGTISLKYGGQEVDLETDGLDKDSTLADLISKLNEKLADLGQKGGDYKGLENVQFELNASGTGIAVSNNSGKSVEFVDKKDANKLANDLGLIKEDGSGVRVESYSHHNSQSLGKRFIGRATDLKDYLGNAVTGVIKMTNSMGATVTLDVSNCKTVGDMIDYINSYSDFGIKAQINANGDGFDIIEDWSRASNPPSTTPTGNIMIEDLEGDAAKKLKIAGVGERIDGVIGGRSHFRNSHNVTIDVMSTDTLETLMYRISEKGGYKTAIVNDGTSTNPYRLTISSTSTGEASDFVIESDLDIFGFNETSRAKDAKVLYGDPNSNSSPILLSSTTNSNSNAILGMTLDLKQVSSEWTTITVDTDKEKVVEELKNMVQTYNDLNDLVSYLDAYDEETGEPGVLFGDTAVRGLMEDINDMFYLIFNPNQQKIGSVDENGVQNTWSWMDLGVSLSAKNTAADNSGAWYSSMDLDLDKLDEMVSKNWDNLYNMLAGQRNAANSGLDKSVRASGIFNGKAAEGFKADNAINGDANKSSWGINNGFMADGTIEEGQNTYEIYFQKATTISRMSVYHFDSDTSLKKYDIEYMDPSTGKWETLRPVTNSTDANHIGFAVPVTASAIRIKAESTNASDGKFRLLDVQVFEDIGLAGQLNNLTTRLGDSQDGFLAEQNTTISEMLRDIDEQMLRLQERLDLKEQNLWKRFTAMESAMGQLNNQSNYFSTMMDSMSTKKK